MTELEEYRARIDAWWRRSIRGRGGYDFWIALYEANARAGMEERHG